MKTRSGIFVDVTEQPGTVVVSVRYTPPYDGLTSAATLFRVILGLADQRHPDEISVDGWRGSPHGWTVLLKPTGAKRAADGLKPIVGILTVEEKRTLQGLLREARRWVEHPPRLTYVESVPRAAGELPALGYLTRSIVSLRSLSALRAAPTAAPETDASAGDPDLRWARPVVRDPGHEHVWEPCASTDEGAVLVVLP